MRQILITLTLLAAVGVSPTFGQSKKKKTPASKAKAAVVALNKKAPDFTAMKADGKPFKFSEFTKKGDKNVVLVFSRGGF